MNPSLDSVSTIAQMQSLFEEIVPDFHLHALMLNTLSYMEHIGATKIARTQSGPQADFMTLKHAAEEARHAYYLKKLALKLVPEACPDYSSPWLLAPITSRQYLYRLDIEISRALREAGLQGRRLHDLAYLLVTYAIELRADEIYPVYQSFLKDFPVKISVQGIINEEEGHLAEMEEALEKWPQELRAMTSVAVAIETRLYSTWLAALRQDLAARA